MALFDFLFRALRRGGGTAAGSSVSPPPATSPRLMSPNERQAALANATPEEMRYNEWQSGHSSWIAGLRYNPIAKFAQMRVKKNGKVYTFGGMAFTTFRAWLTASSWGKFFNAYLKGRYTQSGTFLSVGQGILASSQRASGNTVLRELGIR